MTASLRQLMLAAPATALALFAAATGLAALGSAAGVLPLPRPLAMLDQGLPIAFRFHMLAGGLGLIGLAAVLPLRGRPAWHRPLGRLTAALLLGAAAAGLPAALFSEATWPARAGFAAQSALTALCLVLGWRAIRARDRAVHVRWMLRAAAIVSGVVWLRLAVPVAVWLWLPFDAAYAVIAWASWAVPLGAVLAAQRLRGA